MKKLIYHFAFNICDFTLFYIGNFQAPGFSGEVNRRESEMKNHKCLMQNGK